MRGNIHLLGLFASQAIRVVSALATLPLISHAVSTAAFGQYSFFLTLAQACSVLVDMGFSVTGYGLMSASAGDGIAIFAAVTRVRLAAGGLLALVFVVTAWLVAPSLLGYALASGVLATGLGASALWYLNWRRATLRLVTYEALPVLFMAAGAAGVFAGRWAPEWALAAGGIGGLIGPVILAGRGWLKPPRRQRTPAQALANEAARHQWSIILGRLVVAVYTVAIIPIGRLLIDLPAVGQYAACEKLGGVMGVLGVVAAQAIAPAIVQARHQPTEFNRLVRRIFWIGGGVTVLVVAPLMGVAGRLVGALFGPNFSGLDMGASLVLAASALAFWNAILWNGIAIPLGRRQGFLGVSALGAGVSVLATIGLSGLGYLALCDAKLGSELAIFVFSVLILPRRLRSRTTGEDTAPNPLERTESEVLAEGQSEPL